MRRVHPVALLWRLVVAVRSWMWVTLDTDCQSFHSYLNGVEGYCSVISAPDWTYDRAAWDEGARDACAYLAASLRYP